MSFQNFEWVLKFWVIVWVKQHDFSKHHGFSVEFGLNSEILKHYRAESGVIYKNPPLFKLMFLKSAQLFRPPEWNVILEYFHLTIQQAAKTHVFNPKKNKHGWQTMVVGGFVLLHKWGEALCLQWLSQLSGGSLPPPHTLFLDESGRSIWTEQIKNFLFDVDCWWCISITSRKWYNSICCGPFFQFPDRCNTQRQKARKVKAKDYSRF